MKVTTLWYWQITTSVTFFPPVHSLHLTNFDSIFIHPKQEGGTILYNKQRWSTSTTWKTESMGAFLERTSLAPQLKDTPLKRAEGGRERRHCSQLKDYLFGSFNWLMNILSETSVLMVNWAPQEWDYSDSVHLCVCVWPSVFWFKGNFYTCLKLAPAGVTVYRHCCYKMYEQDEGKHCTALLRVTLRNT